METNDSKIRIPSSTAPKHKGIDETSSADLEDTYINNSYHRQLIHATDYLSRQVESTIKPVLDELKEIKETQNNLALKNSELSGKFDVVSALLYSLLGGLFIAALIYFLQILPNINNLQTSVNNIEIKVSSLETKLNEVNKDFHLLHEDSKLDSYRINKLEEISGN